jgi:anti-sigma B factor antagonist
VRTSLRANLGNTRIRPERTFDVLTTDHQSPLTNVLGSTIMSAFPGVVVRDIRDTNSIIFHVVDLELQIASSENVSVLRCRGRLIYGPETEEFVRAARQVIATTKEIVLQMADVTQIDSGGVGALGTAFMAAHNREAEIKLAALHPRVAEVLRITGLELLFDIRNSESEAIRAFVTKEGSAALEGAAEIT